MSENHSAHEIQEVIKGKMLPYLSDNANVFFSSIEYLAPVQFGGIKIETNNYLLVTGIANSKPISEHVGTRWSMLDHIEYKDHHVYEDADIQKILGRLPFLNARNSAILTNEKDMMRMHNSSLARAWGDVPRFYLPIRSAIIDDQDRFDSMVRQMMGLID